MGTEPPAAGGPRGLGGGALNAAAIFSKIKHFSACFGLLLKNCF